MSQVEEQQQDETDEQFEERVLNKRAYQMFNVVRAKLDHTDKITLTEMCYKNNKKQVSLFPIQPSKFCLFSVVFFI